MLFLSCRVQIDEWFGKCGSREQWFMNKNHTHTHTRTYRPSKVVSRIALVAREMLPHVFWRKMVSGNMFLKNEQGVYPTLLLLFNFPRKKRTLLLLLVRFPHFVIVFQVLGLFCAPFHPIVHWMHHGTWTTFSFLFHFVFFFLGRAHFRSSLFVYAKKTGARFYSKERKMEWDVLFRLFVNPNGFSPWQYVLIAKEQTKTLGLYVLESLAIRHCQRYFRTLQHPSKMN